MPAQTIATRASHQTVALMQQAVDACYADVANRFHLVAHHLSRQLRFFKNRQVACARADRRRSFLCREWFDRARRGPRPMPENTPFQARARRPALPFLQLPASTRRFCDFASSADAMPAT